MIHGIARRTARDAAFQSGLFVCRRGELILRLKIPDTLSSKFKWCLRDFGSM
jgi:hypothetical protein